MKRIKDNLNKGRNIYIFMDQRFDTVKDVTSPPNLSIDSMKPQSK